MGCATADGTLHEADVIIWGTGFAATSFLDGVTVTGSDGADLHEAWSDGARAHLGLAVPGFPNFFTIYGPNTNLGGSSIIAMMEAQAGYVAQVARRLAGGDARRVEVRPDVYDDYDREMQSRLQESAWTGCTSWYVDGSRITTQLAGPGHGVPAAHGRGGLVGAHPRLTGPSLSRGAWCRAVPPRWSGRRARSAWGSARAGRRAPAGSRWSRTTPGRR